MSLSEEQITPEDPQAKADYHLWHPFSQMQKINEERAINGYILRLSHRNSLLTAISEVFDISSRE